MGFNTGYDPRGGHVIEKPVRSGPNPFVGTSYEQMFENNPYKDLYYEPTFWDNIGLSNKAKDANAEYERLYNEYIAGIYDQQRQDEYNSPSSEAERMRQAGINPDLSGLTGESNTDAMEAPNAGVNPALNGVSPATSSLQTMGSILSFALNAYQGVSSTLMAKDASDITIFKDLTEMAKPFVTQSFAEAFMNGHTPELGSPAVAAGTDAFSRQFSSRRMQKRASKAFEHLFFSGDYELQRNALKNANEMFDENIGFMGRQMFSDGKADKSIKEFVKLMVNEGIKEYEVSRKSNINAKTKEAMLDGFRKDSIEKMIESYKKSNGSDILTGFMLAGLLQSSGLPMLNDPYTYLMGAGDKISKDVGAFLDKIFFPNR